MLHGIINSFRKIIINYLNHIRDELYPTLNIQVKLSQPDLRIGDSPLLGQQN